MQILVHDMHLHQRAEVAAVNTVKIGCHRVQLSQIIRHVYGHIFFIVRRKAGVVTENRSRHRDCLYLACTDHRQGNRYGTAPESGHIIYDK